MENHIHSTIAYAPCAMGDGYGVGLYIRANFDCYPLYQLGRFSDRDTVVALCKVLNCSISVSEDEATSVVWSAHNSRSSTKF